MVFCLQHSNRITNPDAFPIVNPDAQWTVSSDHRERQRGSMRVGVASGPIVIDLVILEKKKQCYYHDKNTTKTRFYYDIWLFTGNPVSIEATFFFGGKKV
eukprot:459033_1